MSGRVTQRVIQSVIRNVIRDGVRVAIQIVQHVEKRIEESVGDKSGADGVREENEIGDGLQSGERMQHRDSRDQKGAERVEHGLNGSRTQKGETVRNVEK